MKGKELRALLRARRGVPAETNGCVAGFAQVFLNTEVAEDAEKGGGKEWGKNAGGFWPTNMGNDSKEMD
jgi:hypothetical protein